MTINKPNKGILTCPCCNQKYKTQKTYFIESKSFFFENNNDFAFICKDCLNKYAEDLMVKKKVSPYSAFKATCALINKYYADSVVDTVITSKKMDISFSSYCRIVNLSQYKGKTFLDTLKEDDAIMKKEKNEKQESEIKRALKKKSLAEVVDESKSKSELKQEQKDNIQKFNEINELYATYMENRSLPAFWGNDYTKEEYTTLENNYQDYLSQYEIKTKVDEELYRTLCQLRLEADKARKTGEFKRYQELIKLWQDTAGSANIKPSQKNTNGLSEKQSYGMLIKKFEETRPISKPSKRFADVDKIKKYIKYWFFGCLAHTLNIKNEYYEEFSKELDKYTVTPPDDNSLDGNDDNNDNNKTDEIIDSLM